MKGKILIIEDDINWQNDIREIFEGNEYHVKVVNNVDEAISVLRKEMFHFITLDMQLNENTNSANSFEGWDILGVAKKLRIELKTPIIVITAFGTQYQKFKADKKLGSLFFMEKQLFNEELLLEIAEREIDRNELGFFNDYRNK